MDLAVRENWAKERESQISALSLRLAQIQDRLGRLTDAFIDGAIEKSPFEERKTAHLMERKDLEEKLAQLKDGSFSIPDRLTEFLELAGSAYLSYKMGFPEEKRELLKIVTSNREVDGKNLYFRLSIPFNEVANRFQNSDSPQHRDIPRTWDRLIEKLVKFFKTNQALKIQSD